MKDKKTFYITTPIYYPSGKFHIGTAYTTVAADALKRYKTLQGYDTYLLTGLDEHGQKIENIAKEKGVRPQEYVDEMAKLAKQLWEKMDIQYDNFIRTTDKKHEEVVEEIFDRFMESGDIYKGEYEGLYCIPCETFFTHTQLVNGKCPDCGREVKPMKEEAYFFNMKKYADRLLKYYEEHPDFVKPEYRKMEMINNFIKPGLEDLCVSRTTFDWGIKVRKDSKHVVYVWLDALTNYITALGYLSEDDSLFKKYWPANVQIVGKDIARFHLIYWPIFLMALGLEIPKTIFVHNWILMKDGKMSKSKGNVVYPELLIDRYGLDSLKYFLLRELPVSQDGIFSPESFVDRYNFDLCNDLGNLVNRTIGMINKYFLGKLPEYKGTLNDNDEEIEKFMIQQVEKLNEKMEDLQFGNALAQIWEMIARTNKYIDETAPWILAKDPTLKEKLASAMYHIAENLRIIATLLKPFMPQTAEKIFEQLGLTKSEYSTWNSIQEYNKKLKAIQVVEKGEPLFIRLDKEAEVEYIKQEMAQ